MEPDSDLSMHDSMQACLLHWTGGSSPDLLCQQSASSKVCCAAGSLICMTARSYTLQHEWHAAQAWEELAGLRAPGSGCTMDLRSRPAAARAWARLGACSLLSACEARCVPAKHLCIGSHSFCKRCGLLTQAGESKPASQCSMNFNSGPAAAPAWGRLGACGLLSVEHSCKHLLLCRGQRSAGLPDFVPHALALGDDEIAAGASQHKHCPPLLTAWLTGRSSQGQEPPEL